MLSAISYFRGNYLTEELSLRLLTTLCEMPELVPSYWNVCEPIDISFEEDALSNVVAAMAHPTGKRSLTFFARKTLPKFILSVDLRLAPFQWTSAHNSISFTFDDNWPGGEIKLARYLPESSIPRFPDYASIPEWSNDTNRYAELRRSFSASEFGSFFAKNRPAIAPFGPYGCIADVHWFNYFGKVYVEAIGKARLLAAGWARVEEIGGGLACYSTEKINDPSARERRNCILESIDEFVWTPGCKPEQKQVLNFDFSEQSLA